jgi:integrating conjugative element membrane protein (TIGR03745 family)
MSRLTKALSLSNIRRRVSTMTTAAVVALMVSPMANAALPTVVASGGTAAATDFLGQLRDYIGNATGLGLLVLTAISFIVVGGASLGVYSNYTKGKATLGDLKVTVIVGAILLMIVMYLAAQSAGVIGTTATFTGTAAAAAAP